jgi:hypothetical protein
MAHFGGGEPDSTLYLGRSTCDGTARRSAKVETAQSTDAAYVRNDTGKPRPRRLRWRKEAMTSESEQHGHETRIIERERGGSGSAPFIVAIVAIVIIGLAGIAFMWSQPWASDSNITIEIPGIGEITGGGDGGGDGDEGNDSG